MADLDDDEKWLARKYFPMLITESESSPDYLLESVAEVAQVVGTRAMRRVLHFCDIRVRVDLPMTFFRCLPTEVYSNESILRAVASMQQSCNLTVTL
ncbi:hypothetical protein [Nostoc sp. ATCC 53789]|uniref:hypothetical protein n=1 Tax=Nostoc sp. ATCC 53789 TaxID=76335 RepID=UPI001F548F74|nr:hypothetical protein [Nostoc sp. ATCC 53789]